MYRRERVQLGDTQKDLMFQTRQCIVKPSLRSLTYDQWEAVKCLIGR